MPLRPLHPRATSSVDDKHDLGGHSSSSRSHDAIGSDATPDPTTRKPQKRGPLVSTACDSCRKRKVKCDGNRPNCLNCSQRSKACTYSTTAHSKKLDVVRERLREANSEIETLRRHIKLFSNDTDADDDSIDNESMNPEQALTLTDIEAKLNGSITGISLPGSNISITSSLDSSTQRSSTGPQHHDNAMTIQEQSHAVQEREVVAQIEDATSFKALFTISTVDAVTRPDTAYEGIFNASRDAKRYFRFYQEKPGHYAYVPVYRILPVNLVSDDLVNRPCVLQHLHCRELLAMGISAEDVLGDARLDFTFLMNPQTTEFVHPFTRWVISYIDAFSGEGRLDWCLRVAAVYCMFHLFRWLVEPTFENYERVPDFARPTPAQMWIPHSLWIDLVLLPHIRDDFILHHEANHLRRWVHIFLQTRIIWSDTDIRTTLALDPASTCYHLTHEFEANIRKLENWYLPG